MIYGYCRVSTSHQRLLRQVNNILEKFPGAVIFKEFYTGTTMNRPTWEKLIKQLKKGDTVVFDSVSRMSRNSEEGFKDYKKLYNLGIDLIFIKEPIINTDVFNSTKNNLLRVTVQTGNQAVDEYFKGNVDLINNLLMSLAEEQIKSAFEQSQKEVDDLHMRISEGLRERRRSGKTFGMKKGTKIITSKQMRCEEKIKKYCKDFDGCLNDGEVLKLCECSRNSFYKKL